MRLRDRGNHDAWSEFLQIYEPVIYRVAMRFQMQDADAREIVQEVLLRVASAIDRFDPGGRGTFRGWLSQTTRRVAVDRFRRLVGKEAAVGGPANALASVIADHNQLEIEFDLEHRRQLFLCAAEMVRPTVSQSSWSAFWRTAVDDRSAREVAVELGLTEGAVYVARCRVLKRIREYIEEKEAD
ncbi:MAG: sigma-70 family RNA polymerase sigma factor [Planctomycetales bacterium]|nr:sigma-70 family RNA polymerase sigma factor [Planctomycetales bacterium]MCA9219842.1 sigma-70 family RNA polymerase sigma factor [Planctomycetales bacterium]